MKLLVILSAFFAVACAVNPAALYRSRCSEGASYWCENASQAGECGAVEYCIQNFWRGISVQESASCMDCEAFINAIDNVLAQTSVQEEIVDGAKQACVVMGSLMDLCQTLVETLGAEALQELVKELSADEACTVLGFCTKNVAVAQQTNEGSPEVCDLCKDALQEVSTLLSDTTIQQDIENYILTLCPLLKDVLPNCAQMVQDDFPEVIQLLLAYLNPESCTLIGLCPGTEKMQELFTRVMNLRNRVGDQLCDDCKSTLGDIDAVLSNAAFQKTVQLELDQICYTFGSAAPICLLLVNTYTSQIITTLATYLQPDSFCAEFGFCPSDLPVSQIKDISVGADMCTDCKNFVGDFDSLLLNVSYQKLITDEIDQLCDQLGAFSAQCKSYVDMYASLAFSFLASEIDPQQVCQTVGFCSAKRCSLKDIKVGADECTDCKAFFTDIDGLLLNTSVQNMIIGEIDQLCDQLGAFSAQCKSYVNTYASLVFNFLASELDPDQACEMIGFCPAHLLRLLKRIGLKVDECTDCKTFFGDVQGLLNNVTVENMITQDLEALCAQLGSFADQCKSYVDQYAFFVYSFLASEINPDQICSLVQFCPSEVQNSAATCAMCESLVTAAETYISSEKSQEEIEMELEALCAKLGSFAAQCNSLVQTYTPTIINMVLSYMDPKTMCTEIKMCPGTSRISKVRADPAVCTDCKTFMADIVTVLNSTAFQNEIIAEVESLCSMAGSLEAECKLLVETYLPPAFAYLIAAFDPDTVCIDLGLCTSKKLTTIPLQSQSALPQIQPMESLTAARPLPHASGVTATSTGCEFCKTIVGIFSNMLLENKTEEEILDAVSELCDVLPTAEKLTCISYVKDYGYLILEMLKNSLDPESVCKEIGECTSSTKITSFKSWKGLKKLLAAKLPTDDKPFCSLCQLAVQELDTILSSNKSKEEIKQDVEKYICGNLPSPLNGQCVSFMMIYGDVLVQLLIEQFDPTTFCAEVGLCDSTTKLPKPVPQVEASTECIVCEFMVSELEKLITENSTEAEIRLALDKVCEQLPGTLTSDCESLVNTYTEEIVEYLVHTYNPKALCLALRICEPGAKAIQAKANPPECALCEFIVEKLEKDIPEDATEAEIRQLLDDVCDELPATIRTECDAFVKTFEKEMIEYLVHHYGPKGLCVAINICSPGIALQAKTEPKMTPDCILCEYVLSEVDSLLGENATKEEIEAALDKVCDVLPATLTTECEDFVEQYGPFLISYLVQELDPTKFCTEIGLCSSEKVVIEEPSASVECAICEYVVQELDTMLEKNSTEAEIKKALDEVCDELPATVRSECENFVATYEPLLIKYLLDESPDQICTLFKLCAGKLTGNLNSIECDLCQTAVREFMDTIQEPSISKEIVAVINDTCAILPEDIKATCYNYVDQYGDLVTQFIAQFFDPITTCTLLDACPYPDNSPIPGAKAPRKRLLGQHECTQGPAYWCSSMETATSCGMVEHCQRHVWN